MTRKMRPEISVALGAALAVALVACGKQERANAPAAPPAAAALAADVEALKSENEKLKGEVAALSRQLEEALLTPAALLSRVTEAVAAGKATEAREATDALNSRYPDTAQAKSANLQFAKFESSLREREAQAKVLEAKGFFAVQPTSSPKVDTVTLKVESLHFADRWLFDAQGDSFLYRPAERGERYLVMRATVRSEGKSPDLPDVGIYKIEGKTMTLIGSMDYRFRRWESYGTFIGLYHDSANDFSTTASVSFNAAVAVSVENAKQPLAVVATGKLCHSLSKVIGQPSIQYSRSYNCDSKRVLAVDDFADGGYRVLAFFNRPRGV